MPKALRLERCSPTVKYSGYGGVPSCSAGVSCWLPASEWHAVVRTLQHGASGEGHANLVELLLAESKNHSGKLVISPNYLDQSFLGGTPAGGVGRRFGATVAGPSCKVSCAMPLSENLLAPWHTTTCLTHMSLDLAAVQRGAMLVTRGSRSGAPTAHVAAMAALSSSQRRAWARFFDATGLRGAASVRSAAVSQRAGTARIIALGGSMLAGSGCVDGTEPPHSATCTYSNRLMQGLSAVRADRSRGTRVDHEGDAPSDAADSIEWVSLARGGLTTSSSLPSLPSLLEPYTEADARSMPTLLLVDFSVNDALEGGAIENVGAALETLLRFVMSACPQMAVLLCETYSLSYQV